MPQAQIPSPIGGVRVTVDAHGAVVAVVFVDDELAGGGEPGPAAEAVRQIEEYFAGSRRDFDLPLAPGGSEFERRVWAELVRIPFGATESYGAIAQRLGDAGLSRAVGAANARNPIAVVVPCHRVVGAAGDLTGYAGGLWRKRWLLAHESGQRRLAFGDAHAMNR
ncbi:MAG TPA: methylated-DNA--[protein]-cysteine S-methyltransferase [Chondromyces sp.]|nr:methylated-DNA--[protein]-cysteine S-methyltransferase [Chondromyces sp.]